MARGARVGLAAILSLVLCAPRVVEACQCLYEAPPCETYWTTPLVFSGEVVAIEPFQNPATKTGYLRVRFRVDRTWRGEGVADAVVTTPSSSGLCGFPFKHGVSYVVFAQERNGHWVTGTCNGTVALQKATDTLAYLNQSHTEASGGRIFGTARFLGSGWPGSPAAGLNITLSDAKLSMTTITRADGSFEFTDLPTGKYQIKLPFGAQLKSGLPLIELADTRGCALADVVMSPSTLTILGTVVRSKSRPAANVKVVVHTVDPPRDVVASVVSDGRGKFSVRVPAGRRYLVVAALGGERGEIGPFELTAATEPVLIVLRKKK